MKGAGNSIHVSTEKGMFLSIFNVVFSLVNFPHSNIQMNIDLDRRRALAYSNINYNTLIMASIATNR